MTQPTISTVLADIRRVFDEPRPGGVVQDGQAIRVPAMMMDSVQRSIRDGSPTIPPMVSPMTEAAMKKVLAEIDRILSEVKSAQAALSGQVRASITTDADAEARRRVEDARAQMIADQRVGRIISRDSVSDAAPLDAMSQARAQMIRDQRAGLTTVGGAV